MQKRIKNGLDNVRASIVDVDNSSLFDIFIPKQLKLGRNEIKLRLVNDKTLVKGSELLIDILDQESKPLYYEISPIANEDKSRSIVVYVQEDDLTGKGKLFIYGNITQETTYLCIINLEINSRLETDQEIKFEEPPEIFYQEKRIPIQNFRSETRQLFKRGSNAQISTQSPIVPKQLVDGTFNVERSELKPTVSNGNTTNAIASSSNIQIPEYSNLAILSTNNFAFSSSFKGGKVWVRNINLEIPNDAINQTQFQNLNYSASIIDVVSTSSIQVYPPFYLNLTYDTNRGKKSILFDKFINHSNFTCSYFDVLTLSQGSYTQSYAQFDVFNLDPKVGKVDSIDVSFKNLSLIGDNYQPAGNYKVRSENLLIDSNNLAFDFERGIIEKQIGIFETGFETYWQTSSLPPIAQTNNVPNGINIQTHILSLKDSYSPILSKDGSWVLSFDYYSQPSQSFSSQLDVYISGSGIKKTGETNQLISTPSQSQQLGIYIGSVTEKRGSVELIFDTTVKSKITPKIRPTQGLWSIGNIKLRPSDKSGYTTKQTRIFVPLEIPTGSELNFKFDYLNPTGKKTTTFSSILPGVYFEGSFKPSAGGGTVTIPPGTVSGSDQLTSSYDNRYERRGTGIFSSSNQIGPTGIYSGSGQVLRNTIVSASNLKIETNLNDDHWHSGFQFDVNYGINNTLDPQSGSLIVYTGNDGDDARTFLRASGEEGLIELLSRVISENKSAAVHAQQGHADAQYISGSESTNFRLAGEFTTFEDNRTVKRGLEYYSFYSSSLLLNPLSIPDVSTVRLMLTQSVNFYSSSFDQKYEQRGSGIISSSTQVKNLLPTGVSSGSEQFTSSYDNRYEQKGTGIVSSSTQIKNLLPTGVSSGSEQFTSSYDTRYERKGTGVLSSSNGFVSGSDQLTGSYDLRYHRLGTGLLSSSQQIGTDISGSFVSASNSLSGRIGIFENKTLISGSEQLTSSYDTRYERKGTNIFSSSGQIDYNSINNKPIISGSGIYRLLISSGSNSSSSYADPRLTYDTSQSKFSVTGSTNLNGNLFQTGSTSTRMSYTWGGSITVGTTPGIEWTNMPNAINTWLGTAGTFTPDATYIGDFTEISQGRLFTSLQTIAGSATCSLEVQYSLDGSSSWSPMVTLLLGTSPNYKDSGWARIPDASKTFCYIRLVGWGGDGARDPRFSPPICLFR